jgi:hypothetical protein
MKATTGFRNFAATAAVITFAGCGTPQTAKPPQALTRAQAHRLAETHAKTRGIDLAKYRLVEAEPKREWWFFYDGIDQTIGNHFTLFVDEETGKVGMLPGQ